MAPNFINPPSSGGIVGPSRIPPTSGLERSSRPTNATAGAPRPRVARGNIDDPPAPPKRPRVKEERPAPLTLPSPEELGLLAPQFPDNSFDWSPVQRQFRQAGATCFHVDFLPEGGCRLVCLLAATGSDRMHRIEAQAASESAAADLAVQKLAEWQHHNKQ